jgi:hypothetical protein
VCLPLVNDRLLSFSVVLSPNYSGG